MNKQKAIRQSIRKIILLTATIDKDGMVWGHDTEVDHIDNLTDQALAALRPAETCKTCGGSKKVCGSCGKSTRCNIRVHENQHWFGGGDDRPHHSLTLCGDIISCPCCKPPTGQAEGVGWQEGNQPKESHWYLVKYLSSDKPPIVCYEKLWFNPDSIEKWWFQHERFRWQDNIIAFAQFDQIVAHIDRLEAEKAKAFQDGRKKGFQDSRRNVKALKAENKQLQTRKDKYKKALLSINHFCKKLSNTDWFHTSYTADIIKLTKL